MSEEFTKESLSKSEKVIGQIYPVIVNPEGKVLEGHHRLEANPEWERKVVETTSPIEDILVRMHAHHRRRIPQEETKALLLELAKELEKTGVKREDVASELYKIAPYSERYIRQLLPDKYKKSGLTKEKAEITPHLHESVKTQHDFGKPKIYQCGFPDCPRSTYYPTFYLENIPVCPYHNEQIQKDQSLLEKLKEKPSLPKKVEAKEYKLKDKWEHRAARMKPQVSKMETAIALRLQEKGVPFQAQREFCVQTTTPDFYFPEKNLAVYLDGEKAHQKRKERDEALREKLQRHHGIKAVGIVYRDNTKKSEDEVFNRILSVIENE